AGTLTWELVDEPADGAAAGDADARDEARASERGDDSNAATPTADDAADPVSIAGRKLALAEDQLQHAERMQSKGFVTPREVEAARLDVLKARRDVERARAGREDAKEVLEIDVLVAEHNLTAATERLQHTERLAEKGFVSPAQVEAARLDVEAACEKLNRVRAQQDPGERNDDPDDATARTNEPAQAAPNAQADPDGKQTLSDAVSRGIGFLRTAQNADGGWAAPQGGFETGVTALVTLALLESGVAADDAQVARALELLASAEPKRTYEVALQTIVFCRADRERFARKIRQNVEWLSNAQLRNPRAGLWTYTTPQPGGVAAGDNSNTGFALWALDAAAEAGFAVDPDVWRRSLEHWTTTQNADGSWAYTPAAQGAGAARGTGSMTCSGIASVTSCAERLATAQESDPPEKIEAVEQGLQWLTQHFSVRENPGSKHWGLYYLNALQRAARRTSRARIGEHDWYQQGARHLLATQAERGSWSGTGAMENDPVIGTSLALLFLKSGAAPREGDGPPEPANGNAAAATPTIRLRFHATDGERWNEDTPIAGLRVLVWPGDAVGETGRRPLEPKDAIARGTTGQDGTLAFRLAPGSYYVRWESDKELPYPRTLPRSFEVKPAPAEQEQGFGLTRGATLVLKAVDADTGRGLPGVRFWWENMAGEWWMEPVRPSHLGTPDVRGTAAARGGHPTGADGEVRLYWFRGPGDTFGIDKDSLPAGYEVAGPAEIREEDGRFRPGETIEHTFKLVRKAADDDAARDRAVPAEAQREDAVTPETRAAIARGLRVLVRSQQDDGAIGSGKTYQKNVAVTALAGMAFLAAGSTPERGEYAEPLRKCRDFILRQMRPDGFISHSEFTSHGPMYEHAYATQFLALLHERQPDAELLEKLQRAVDLIVRSQNTEGGWRYEPESQSSDVSVTACNTVALELAARGGAKVPQPSRDAAIAYIRQCQNADGGFRYQLVNRAESRFPRSAAALFALELAQAKGDEIDSARAYVAGFKPKPDEERYEPHYFYGQRYAALAMHRAGGDTWREWYAAIRDVLLRRQNADGTWPGDSICAEYGTASACIILQR
ncbi:MAG TPA: prenyltransferase/squalene oxidase repeat-containing protein, partial [Planctomycetaceae bacterium]|nr:prenyltransferase/squalene oxidase repeat-containing protein [Planctomycetaceae bacterium]